MPVASFSELSAADPAARVKQLAVDRRLRPRLRRLDPARYGSLGRLADAMALFVPGLLYLRGRWSNDRWCDLVDHRGEAVEVGYLHWPSPLVRLPPAGDGSRDWDRTLMAVPWEHAAAAQDLVCGAAQSDPAGWTALYATQVVAVPDVTAGGVVVPAAPPVPLVAFAVRSSASTYALRGDPPTCVTGPADPEAVGYAAAFGRGDNPVAAVVNAGRPAEAAAYRKTGRLPRGWNR